MSTRSDNVALTRMPIPAYGTPGVVIWKISIPDVVTSFPLRHPATGKRFVAPSARDLPSFQHEKIQWTRRKRELLYSWLTS
jgi:hypothetical protein